MKCDASSHVGPRVRLNINNPPISPSWCLLKEPQFIAIVYVEVVEKEREGRDKTSHHHQWSFSPVKTDDFIQRSLRIKWSELHLCVSEGSTGLLLLREKLRRDGYVWNYYACKQICECLSSTDTTGTGRTITHYVYDDELRHCEEVGGWMIRSFFCLYNAGTG